MSLAHITLHRLRVPLKVPYRLSLAEIRAFDTLLVVIRDRGGRSGIGEATYLAGYTHESIEQGWSLAGALAPRLIGEPADRVREILADAAGEAPFTATALTTALEMLAGSPYLHIERPRRVPLLALVHGTDAAALEPELDALIGQGYRTLKLKIGFDVEDDLERVRLIQRLVNGRALLRLDANQAFSREQACRFAAALDPEGIELLEQTCAAGDWEAARAVAQATSVALMLDESIYNLDDVERAAELKAAHYIKFKLMKAGGLERLARALDHIRACGMEPVLGNGVACDVGCWMEACMVEGHIANAGEMNGFLKTERSLLRKPPNMDGDAMRLEPEFALQLNEAALERYRMASASFPS